jgi:Tfp pilus assembly PilM family ATPase
MTSSRQTLPLGIDIGRTRVRVALSERTAGGAPQLVAVAAREHDGDPEAALRAAYDELETPERRCVLALAPPDALLCSTDLPPMSRWERARAARFEAARFIDYPIAEAAVTVVPARAAGRWTIGIARRSALADAVRAAKHARLRTLGIDDAAFALQRVYPEAGVAIDLGADATRVIVFGRDVPFVARIPIGGTQLTASIAQALGIHTDEAEERKRRNGFAGAGDAQRDILLAAVTEALANAPADGYAVSGDVILCGNGSRIPGFDAALERATGYCVRVAELPAQTSQELPPDVLRACAPDWSIAYGLCLWNHA